VKSRDVNSPLEPASAPEEGDAADLAEALAAARRRLEEAQAEAEELAYIFSHDFRAPLRGLNSLAAWLEEDYADRLDAQGLEHLADMRQCARRLMQMVDGALRYSRVGRRQLDRRPTDSEAIFQAVWRELKPPAGISFRIESPMPRILSDRELFRQLAACLLDNAIAHRPAPKGFVAVSATETDLEWRFCVRDDGAGVAASCHSRIFGLFQMAAATDEANNAGVGLAIARKIAQRHGGRLRIESEPGSGSAFWLELPKFPPAHRAANGSHEEGSS